MKIFCLLFIYFLIGGCVANGVNPNDYTPGTVAGISEGKYIRDKNQGIREVTNNFSRVPTSEDVTDYINKNVSPPGEVCLASIEVINDSKASLAHGARKVLANFFQSCSVLDVAIDSRTPNLKGVSTIRVGPRRSRVVTDNNSLLKSNIFMQALNEDKNYPPENCTDARSKPPIYGYASRKLPNKDGEIDLFTAGDGVGRVKKTGKSSFRASGIDCSGFVTVALASQGLKLTESSSGFPDVSTKSLKDILANDKSCLKTASINKSESLKDGDLLNLSGNHVVIIDEVSDDPLGIKKYSKLKNCNGIKISDFDFTYIHSGSINNSYGPSRVHSSKHNGGEMFNSLRLMAVKMCNKFKNSDSEFDSNDVSVNDDFDIIRHRSKDVNCVSSTKVKMKNEECINGCMEER